MKRHTYTSIYDPKHGATPPALTRANVDVSATAPTVVRIPNAAPGGTDLLDARTAGKVVPAPIQAAISRDDKACQAMVSEGGPATAQPGVRVPNPAPIGLATLPAGSVTDMPFKAAPASSTKTH